jgi:F-type H+-transporting ATPase subunit gamma
MVSVKELRDRVGSVKNTKKITSAMKLVAAAKVRRAQDAVLQGRPFSVALEGVLGGLIEQAKIEAPDIPLLADRDVKKVGIVVMAGDRGLCGGYNAQVIKKAELRLAELKSQGIDVELITVGNKAGSYFGKRETPVRLSVEIGQSPTALQSTQIADALLPSYYAGDIDRVEIIYTSFQSMISTVPSIRTLIPLLPDGLEMEEDEIFKLTSKDGEFAVEKEKVPVAEPAKIKTEMIFEQDPAQLLDTILTLYLNGQLLRTMQESVASELASRMQAMQSATDNANDLQKSLELQMNRARQSKITQELTEIVGGAAATA